MFWWSNTLYGASPSAMRAATNGDSMPPRLLKPADAKRRSNLAKAGALDRPSTVVAASQNHPEPTCAWLTCGERAQRTTGHSGPPPGKR